MAVMNQVEIFPKNLQRENTFLWAYSQPTTFLYVFRKLSLIPHHFVDYYLLSDILH